MMTRVLLRGILALSSATTAAAFVPPCALRAAGASQLPSVVAAAATTNTMPIGSSFFSSAAAVRSYSAGPLKATAMSDTSSTKDKPWQINLLYDGKCSLCMKEVSFLQKRDLEDVIKFTDLNDPNFKPEENGGVDYEAGMKRIHAVLPDGKVVEGVEVFRRVYEVIGLGWVYAATKLPVVGTAVDKVYDWWAVNRLKWTGRPELEELIKQRQEELKSKTFDPCDDDGECEIDWDKL